MKNNQISLFKRSFENLGEKMIKIKYFLMVVGAMLFEILTLVIFIFRGKVLVGFDAIEMGYFYGFSNTIILILAISGLVKGFLLNKNGKEKDLKKVNQINNFKVQYSIIRNRYSIEIEKLIRDFDDEKNDINKKIEYAGMLEERYSRIYEEFSKLKIADFLKEIHGYELEHLFREKLLFASFIDLADKNELNNISRESNKAHTKFLKCLEKLEQNLKFRIEDINTRNFSNPPSRRYSYFNL